MASQFQNLAPTSNCASVCCIPIWISMFQYENQYSTQYKIYVEHDMHYIDLSIYYNMQNFQKITKFWLNVYRCALLKNVSEVCKTCICLKLHTKCAQYEQFCSIVCAHFLFCSSDLYKLNTQWAQNHSECSKVLTFCTLLVRSLRGHKGTLSVQKCRLFVRVCQKHSRSCACSAPMHSGAFL